MYIASLLHTVCTNLTPTLTLEATLQCHHVVLTLFTVKKNYSSIPSVLFHSIYSVVFPSIPGVSTAPPV